MSAHFAAAVPHVRIMEIEMDDVAWHADFVIRRPRIEAGSLILDEAPGWGADVDEDAVRAHPVPGAGQRE
jgi:L-alanine-DL-glutamate epimerase-like enolase superfamily enzyme